MKNRMIVLAIGLGLVLSISVLAFVPGLVLAQGCTDARGNSIPCPESGGGGGGRKKATPSPYPSYTPTPPPTLTASMTPAVSPSPTKSQPLSINTGGNQEPKASGPLNGWPLAFGSETTKMLFDGDTGHTFTAGLVGLLGGAALAYLGLSFIRKRAPRINFESFKDDTNLVFHEHHPSGGSMPLQTELDMPAEDDSEKDPAKMVLKFPGDSGRSPDHPDGQPDDD